MKQQIKVVNDFLNSLNPEKRIRFTTHLTQKYIETSFKTIESDPTTVDFDQLELCRLNELQLMYNLTHDISDILNDPLDLVIVDQVFETKYQDTPILEQYHEVLRQIDKGN